LPTPRIPSSAATVAKLRRADAQSLARVVVRRAELRPCALILLADGKKKILATGPALTGWLAKAPGCLVGCYDHGADAEMVTEDILAMG